ncbi:hypothetical protein KXV85_000453, partial [Aspergillus fumigatus]
NGKRIDKRGHAARHSDPLGFVEPFPTLHPLGRKQLGETDMIVRQHIDAQTPGRAHGVVGSGIAVHAGDERRRIHGHRTDRRHGQTMPFTVAVRRHDAYASGKEPHALLEHVG